MNMMMTVMPTLPMQADLPTTTAGRRGVASAVSLMVHALIIAAAIGGVFPSYHAPTLPPDLVVEVVVDQPPPPPAIPEPPPKVEPLPKVQPQLAPVQPKVRAERPKVMPTTPQISQPTSPSPAAEAVAAPSVPASAPVGEEAVAAPPPQKTMPSPVKVDFDGEARRVFLDGITSKVQAKVVYPSLSLKRGEQGKVHIHVKLSRDGTVVDMQAEDEGLSPRLQDAAMRAIKDAAPFTIQASVPGDPVEVTIPVAFEIR